MAHETMNFQRMEEVGGANTFRKYDPKYAPRKAKILGNTKAGDGERYKGRGFIQLTGRYNYKRAGEALGIPLEKNPELAADPEIAAQVAIWFWKLRVQPRVDNFKDVKAVTKPINPGLRGLADRKEKFQAYKVALI
jgi:predicted chitinase